MQNMPAVIAFVAGQRYRHYLESVERSLSGDAFRVEYYEPEAFVALPDDSALDSVVTVHSIDQKLLNKLAELRKSKPTITLQDGLIEYAHCCVKEGSRHRYRPIVTDFLLTFGKRPQKIAEARCNSSSIVATGSPRFDMYHEHQSSVPDMSLPVLVTTANTPWQDRHSKKHFSQVFFQLLRDLVALGVRFRLRLPDKVKKELAFRSPLAFKKLLKTKLLAGVSAASTPLLDDLLNSSAVITTPSTVALEAMILSRPTALLVTEIYPLYLESAFPLISRKSFQPALRALVERGRDFDERMAFQELIKSENVIDDGRATQRVVDLIKDVLR